MSDFTAPKWSRELVKFLPAKLQFILWGNIHDVYPIKIHDNFTTLRIDAFINKTLREYGYSLIVKYEPPPGFSLLENGDSESFRKITRLDAPAKASLPKATEIINTLINTKDINCAVILNFASRIGELCSGNGNDVNEFFYNMFRLTEMSHLRELTRVQLCTRCYYGFSTKRMIFQHGTV